MPQASKVGRNILRAIYDRQMTPAEFARKADISESYFSRLKNGSISEPSRPQLQKIADALSVPVAVLVGDARSPTVDAGLATAVAEALGTSKAHLFEQAIEALRELPPAERDQAIDVLHVIATNWPRPSRP